MTSRTASKVFYNECDSDFCFDCSVTVMRIHRHFVYVFRPKVVRNNAKPVRHYGRFTDGMLSFRITSSKACNVPYIVSKFLLSEELNRLITR